MSKLFMYPLKKLANLLNKIIKGNENPVEENIQAERVKPWFKDNGDKTHRLNYDLSERSIVFDLGGYEGQWASDIFSMYQCNIYIFEPLPQYAGNIQTRFKRNDKIKVYDYGLANANKTTKLTISNDASSAFIPGADAVDIKLMDAEDFFTKYNISHINLMKINIEGAEYELLEHLIAKKLVNRIENIQVQFHDFVPDAEARMTSIQQQLLLTHNLTYQYPFVWENWTLNKKNRL